ncbi:MAG: glycosyltransferase family 4 protein [Butyrivibrio sp.]|nr:glycosyltransferase family 4 protein [Muribaculum sp.]MCM1551472.1 glycosyltransferase family 4 protein [Butyrivibrio sp.]
MRVLWLCNIMLPMIADKLHIEASNKEGWLSGLASVVLERQGENGIELAVAFPAPAGWERTQGKLRTRGRVQSDKGHLLWYTFTENMGNPHIYPNDLEGQMKNIICHFKPDIVHCFGTEYPHTLAMCRAFPDKSRILVGIQGLCRVYAGAYFANLPDQVKSSATLRDLLKRDTLRQQQHKFVLRGQMEYEAIRLAGNVTGRTAWDRHYTAEWNPEARYFAMNETLRGNFYEGRWNAQECEPHSIFLSQGDYPIKGLHYMLLALPAIREELPDVKVYVAGNGITGEGSLIRRAKISAYGLYLRGLIKKHHLQEQICFLGRLDAEQMKQRYLRSNLFVCCSSIENSPNSLGEAMILGVPCVSADVGGISSIFTHEKDGILYEGFKSSENSYNNDDDLNDELTLEEISQNLAKSVIQILTNPDKMMEYSQNARNHALKTHDPEQNYRRMTEIYAEIVDEKKSSENPPQTESLPQQNNQPRLTNQSQLADQPRLVKLPRLADQPQLVFVSNYINHHQIPFCNALYELLKGEFVFIQTEPMEEERVRMGWQREAKLPYVRYYYEEPEACQRLIADCPQVLFGGVDDESYITERLQSGKPIIRYSERIYKEGQWKAVSPRGLLKKYHDHTKYRNKPIYLLCAGAYVPSDFHIIRAYPDKLLKWGYFPETRHYDTDQLMKAKKPASILWAARFLDWKHPETAINCARYLKENNICFHMNIVGDGEQRPLVEHLLEEYGLAEQVTLLGYRTPDEVRELMEQSEIYLTTSDRKEGWGAVINEAMNSGCAVVASHMMGAAPYLIRHGQNGFVYDDSLTRNGQNDQLCELTARLLQDRELRERLGRAAILTIEEEWNAENAAARLLEFCETLEPSAEGPCSPAEVISERKMLWTIRQKNQ